MDGNTRLFSAGELIFREGEQGDCAYIVERGQVEIATIHAGKRKVLCVMGPGTLFGEMAVIDDVVRSADAFAVAETLLVKITREQLRTRVSEADPITQLLLRVILERFRREMRLFRTSELAGATGPEQSMRPELFQHDAVEKMKLEGELRAAIRDLQLVLHYQPIVRLTDGNVVGFEALVRWQHPVRGLVAPNLFVPLAEETALVVPMGDWVLVEACSALVRFNAAIGATGAHAATMSVNVSGRQFAEPDFIEKLQRTADQTAIPRELLHLEITEGILMDYPDVAIWMAKCKAAGFKVTLDDFGTGFSSLSYLHRFPTDQLKVDRSFVQSMNSNVRSLEIVRAVVGLAHGLGMELVAEGIETPEELAALRALRCEYGQGYLFSRPVPEAEALAFAIRTRSGA